MGFWHVYMGIEGGGGAASGIDRPCLTTTENLVTATVTRRAGITLTVTERGCNG